MSLGRARTTIFISVVFVALFPEVAKAQSAAPRDYLNTPIDAVSFFADFMASKAVTAPESELPLPNTEAVSRLGVITALYSFPLGNKYGGVAVNGGYSTVEVNGPAGTLRKNGFIDPSIFFHVNIFGAPALRVNQFSQVPRKHFRVFTFRLRLRSARTIATLLTLERIAGH